MFGLTRADRHRLWKDYSQVDVLGLRPSGLLEGVTDGAALASDGEGSEQAVSQDPSKPRGCVTGCEPHSTGCNLTRVERLSSS